MLYYSTNSHSSKVPLKDAIIRSQAPDGGLYMPEKLPHVPQAIFNNISEMSPVEISYFVAYSLFGNDIPSRDIKRIGEEAFNFPVPLVEIEPGIYALELFHGPTCTVKDIGIRYFGRLLSLMNPDYPKPLNVMVATTGHSGCAVANGFHHVEGINVFAIYPSNTPDKQVAQIATLGDNVYAVSVNGNIDQCRNIVRTTISDQSLNNQIRFTCVNSVNIGRVLPVIIPYFLAYAQFVAKNPKTRRVKISVPCGNGGILAAGYMAKQMGLPIDSLIAGCNQNGAFHNYLNNPAAQFSKNTIRTHAYAMDSSFPSNLARFDHLCYGDKSQLRKDIQAYVCSDEEISSTIIDVYSRTGYVLDPHSAISYRSLKRSLSPGEPGIFFATAHPARCSDFIYGLIGKQVEVPAQLSRLIKGCRHERSIPPTYPAWRKYLLKVLDC